MAEEPIVRRGTMQQDPLWQWGATCDCQVTAGAASDTARSYDIFFIPHQQLGGHPASHFSSPQPVPFLTHVNW